MAWTALASAQWHCWVGWAIWATSPRKPQTVVAHYSQAFLAGFRATQGDLRPNHPRRSHSQEATLFDSRANRGDLRSTHPYRAHFQEATLAFPRYPPRSRACSCSRSCS